ncbi:hypothetical protein ACP70R_015181 [Stipagrostis hirtigluma subsp. patula]
MEVVFSAVISEIANRFISFLVDKCSKRIAPTMDDQMQDNLHRVLLRVRVIVEEAEGRIITNQAMVYQLNILRKEMYRGYYTMDNFRSQANEEDKVEDHDVSQSFVLSKFNPAKRLFFTGHTHRVNEVQQVIDNINSIIVNMGEFITFLKDCPPLHRQPYSMHLIVDNYMFGRQMEFDRIMNFLMTVEPPSSQGVGILPIVGPPTAGKSTLVAHVSKDERVRNYFTQILFVTEDDLGKGLTTEGNERLLAIIELTENIDEAALRRYLASATGHASVIKIIITSRSRKIMNFGTTQALMLNFLPLEAYWYFFKVRTFGSADPNYEPKLESIAMEISRDLYGSFSGSFISGSIISGLLRENINAQHWNMVHTFLKLLIKKTSTSLTAHDRAKENKPVLRRRANNDEFGIYDFYQCSADDTIPKITVSDVAFGNVKCEGRFEALAWMSRIPPYKNYIYVCEVQKTQPSKKRQNVKPH